MYDNVQIYTFFGILQQDVENKYEVFMRENYSVLLPSDGGIRKL